MLYETLTNVNYNAVDLKIEPVQVVAGLTLGLCSFVNAVRPDPAVQEVDNFYQFWQFTN